MGDALPSTHRNPSAHTPLQSGDTWPTTLPKRPEGHRTYFVKQWGKPAANQDRAIPSRDQNVSDQLSRTNRICTLTLTPSLQNVPSGHTTWEDRCDVSGPCE